ncbi:septation protein A [Catenovulum adriaticum]|uniref:Inner membrane-spanning protein YciB n=1 Tax=Catenovulum adriaticum TaxID=2984846 RepID=A0ABY7AP04_9ALTE|nr:septation protein A [Catenovulum sp. TS8]WAJ70997.1 septation protein A [Catenovulum sp. TS8]
MQNLFEYLHIAVFFIVYKTVDIYWATAALIGTTGLHLIYAWVKEKTLPKKHLILFLIVLLMGGLTIYFQNDEFIKWKVTVVNGLFALGIFISQAFFKISPIEKMLGKEIQLPSSLWAKVSYAWSAFFAALAVLNLYIAYNFSQDFWVNFKLFGLMGLTIAFTVITIAFLYPHLPKEETPNKEKEEH